MGWTELWCASVTDESIPDHRWRDVVVVLELRHEVLFDGDLLIRMMLVVLNRRDAVVVDVDIVPEPIEISVKDSICL